MKKILILLAGALICVTSCQKTQDKIPGSKTELTEADLETEDDKTSYVFGYLMGSRYRSDGFPINPDIYQAGLKDGLSGRTRLVDEEETKKIMMSVQKKVMEKRRATNMKQMDERKKHAGANKEKGTKFLEENKAKEGVVSLQSGLQYKILKKGTGASPKATDTVKCHYKGTTIDGKEFDSSYKRGEPATFALNRVIKGWTEGLQLMKEGGKWQFFIPSELAYGERGSGPNIGPNEVLIFEVELLEIEKPTTKKTDDKG